jgi:DNA-binding LacI/PurR family transcriptional regulator
MSSVRSIAEEAGVSITTVSRVLNNDVTVAAKTRDLVLSVANRNGYVAKLGRRITTYIGFAYTVGQTLSSVYDSALLEGVCRGVDECGFDVVILNLPRDKKPTETYTQFFMRKGVRGVVLRTTADSRHVCQAIADEGFPVVVVSERFTSDNVNFIDCDSRTDSARAVEYLINLGHRRIAFAMNTVPDCDHLDRFAGYQQALAAHGLPLAEELVFRHNASLAGGATVLKLAMSMANRPTAIYLADPMLAVGAMNKAHEMGVHIPDELSIVGFDDTDMRYAVHPTMTAVCQNTSALGFEASLRLTRLLTDSSREPLRKTVPSFFEVHQSTAPPPAEALDAPRQDGRAA